MFRRAALLIFLFAMTGAMAPAQGALPVPPGGDPAMACGQKPDGRAYWTEYAFCDLPVQGPAKAKGLVLWSHGVDSNLVQYATPASLLMRRLAQAGWDIVKIDRNNLYERCAGGMAGNLSNCWSAGGARHVDDLLERAKQAKAQGYARIIAAGQSFGGAISVEANAKAPGLFYAVVATSPGHGSDAANAGGSTSAAYYNLDRQLLTTLAAQRTARVVLSLPPLDAFHPNRNDDPIWPKARAALQDDGLPFALFGDGLPINGHGAANTNQFSNWFGACIVAFLDPARSPPAGETKCEAPAVPPKFLLPADLKIAAPGTVGTSRWLGAWEGAFVENRRDLMIVIERIEGETVALTYSPGAGPQRSLSMGYDRYTKGRLVSADTIAVDRGGGRSMRLVLAADGSRVDVQHIAPEGTLNAMLSRSAAGQQ